MGDSLGKVYMTIFCVFLFGLLVIVGPVISPSAADFWLRPVAEVEFQEFCVVMVLIVILFKD